MRNEIRYAGNIVDLNRPGIESVPDSDPLAPAPGLEQIDGIEPWLEGKELALKLAAFAKIQATTSTLYRFRANGMPFYKPGDCGIRYLWTEVWDWLQGSRQNKETRISGELEAFATGGYSRKKGKRK